jgi:RNA polymerase sigma-70 factor (ECF subfamily)
MNQTGQQVQFDEGALVAALQQGDPDAFAELVERHSETIYNLALRMMNNPQEAEEVLQDTFVSAFRALGRFEGRSQLSTWLYRIAYNAALMRLRRRELPTTSLDEPLLGDEGDPMPRQLVDWSAVPDELLLKGELDAVLREAVDRLPEGSRAVFVLRDIEGLSTAETAAVLELTETNVKVRLHRARMALRESLTEYFVSSALPAGATNRESRQEAYAGTL